MQAHALQPGEHFGFAVMAVGAKYERQSWPHLAQLFDHAAQDAEDGFGGGRLARMQGGGDEASALAFIEVEGHEAGVAHVGAEHAEFLLAIDNAGGGIKVEHEAGGHFACVTGDEVVHHRIEGTHELAQREAIVQTAHGRLAGERGIRCAWRGLAHEHLEHGIVAQQVAVVTIGIAADDLHDALGE